MAARAYAKLPFPAQSSSRLRRARTRGPQGPRDAHITGMSLEGTRAPQGLDAEDRLAFGLTASHLSYLLVGSLAGYALLASHLPGVVKYPIGVLCVVAGVVLGSGGLPHPPLRR